MTLKEFKEHIESFEDNTIFPYSLTDVFSWRGIYSEVAFSVEKSPSNKEEILDMINKAYTETFYGYKGGEYSYGDYTDVYFEASYSLYTDGSYVKNLISGILDKPNFEDLETKFVKLAFK